MINCAADYSANYFEKDGIVYKSYHLKDHVRENIECLFYDAIDFIDEAKRKGGKIYIHCVQVPLHSQLMHFRESREAPQYVCPTSYLRGS